jgi:hypothetical protein
MRMFEHPLWPHLRAGLILFHVLSMLVLSLPHAGAFEDRRWRNDNARDDLARMAARLSAWGWTTDAPQLEHDLRSAADGYLRVQQWLVIPFGLYAALTGSRQDWSMFASPQRHPAELHVDLEQAGQWQALYRPHSDVHAWHREQLEHNRFRKFLGRFARGFQVAHYDQTARWIARRAAAEHPTASRVRVQLYRYATLAPAQVRAGVTPDGRYEHERVWKTKALR